MPIISETIIVTCFFSERANIVSTAVDLLNQTGVVIISITADNPAIIGP